MKIEETIFARGEGGDYNHFIISWGKLWNFFILIFLGFLIVAACVMTFEARDSAAKVVPATTANNVDENVTAQKVY